MDGLGKLRSVNKHEVTASFHTLKSENKRSRHFKRVDLVRYAKWKMKLEKGEKILTED